MQRDWFDQLISRRSLPVQPWLRPLRLTPMSARIALACRLGFAAVEHPFPPQEPRHEKVPSIAAVAHYDRSRDQTVAGQLPVPCIQRLRGADDRVFYWRADPVAFCRPQRKHLRIDGRAGACSEHQEDRESADGKIGAFW